MSDDITGLACAKPVSFWERVHKYTADNPLQGWLLTVGLVLALYALGLSVFPDTRKPGLIFIMMTSALGPPTVTLLLRFSKETRAKTPVAPRQEQIVGVSSVFAAVGSIISFGVTLSCKPLGVSVDSGLAFTAGFSFLLMFALAFGIAAQKTKAGRLGLLIAAGWLGVVLLMAAAALLRGHWLF